VNWSDQQLAIFSHVEQGRNSLNIKARAGTGKSTVLVECANRTKGRTLLCAFNKSIADELGSRITGNPHATAATLHSVGFSQWRKIRSKNEVDGRKVRAIAKTFSPWDKAHTDVIVDAVEYAKHIGFGIPGLPVIDDDRAWTELFDHYDLWDEVPSGITPERIIGECVKTYKESVRMACDQGRIDFSDMLLLPLMFAQGKPELYDTVMIDECQDTSSTRRLMALHVLKTGGRVIAVGDDFQCIFHFAGATANAMDLIKEVTGANELPLNITYRCPKSVVALAQSWCPDYTAHEENQEGVVRAISHLKFWGEKLVPGKDAILCRNTRPLVGVARRLRNSGIPCIVEGQSGKAIIALATKWGEDITVDQLDVFLGTHLEKELDKWRAKGREDKAEWAGEKVGILRDLMEDVGGEEPVRRLIQKLEMTFGEGQYQGQDLVRLCTIHRAKGREWDRVFILGRNRYQPSKWAKTKADCEGERNLSYVAVTRAKRELVDVVVPVPDPKRGGGSGSEWWEE